MKVLKFGGTSVGSAGSIERVCDIIREQSSGVIIVVSAMSGVTNLLEDCLRLASSGDNGYQEILDKIEKKHCKTANEILDRERAVNYCEFVKSEVNRLRSILNSIANIGEVTARSTDLVLGFGEALSVRLTGDALAARAGNISNVDAHDMIFTRMTNGSEMVDHALTEKAIREKTGRVEGHIICPGFVASSVQGYPTTLGRGGSDYTAALIAAAIDAEMLEIWTDVSGIYTADPAFTEEAYPIAELSYAEAMELSHFGAKVIYPPSLEPVRRKNIPVLVKNTFAPADRGTMITSRPSENHNNVKGVSSIDGIALVSLTGSGMVGVVGIASRVFSTLAASNINVILITQASSEQSICIAISDRKGEQACRVINEEFASEIASEMIRPAILETGFSIIGIVGERMKQSVGISGQAFASLGRNGVNIHAIAQGSSELNISVVVKKGDCHKAVNAIHQEFFTAVNRIVNLFIVGTGNVGTALVEQLLDSSAVLERDYQTGIRIVGIANSRKMLIDPKGIRTKDWKTLLMDNGHHSDLAVFFSDMVSLNLPNSIFVDNTASTHVTSFYEKILSRSISVVTCNKIAAASSYDTYLSIKNIALRSRVHFKFESNVGAGLPIIQTIENMVKTGDRLYKIEAVLSGSLNFIFNSFCNGSRFSDAVADAIREGYTEPDPLIDLKGKDVGRKLLILVREAGFGLEEPDVIFHDYLPRPINGDYQKDNFIQMIKEYDPYFEELRKGITSRGSMLRVIARYAEGKAEISLEEVGRSHPFYNIEGSDNIVSIYSKRYLERPLIVKGAGAGADVTASGIFADILSVINS